MTTLEILKAARALIENPSHWAKGELAYDAMNRACEPDSPHATGFCTEGALARVAGDYPNYRLALKLLGTRLPEPFGSTPVFEWQDRSNTTHADVLALFDRTIAAEEARNG